MTILNLQTPVPMAHGDISNLIPISDKNALTKNVVFVASVFNDYSSYEIIKSISSSLGELTCQYTEIKNIEVPLLGTGAGRLSEIDAARGLRDGFMETARKDARLSVFLFRNNTVEMIYEYFDNPISATEFSITPPDSIKSSSKLFYEKYGDQKTAFVVMSFIESPAHEQIYKVIQETCRSHNIVAVRADSPPFSDNLLDNVLTYVYCCTFGITVFERIKSDIYNPNVSFEAGYLLGLNKEVLFLKDNTLNSLPTDLIGKLYREFDFLLPKETLPKQITRWLLDKNLINN